RMCHDNSRPGGFVGAALESLGLVTNTWHGQLVPAVNDSLARLDQDARDFFWHGAGRSMYFSPINFLPGFSPFRMSAQRPPDERARLSARAGAAWAFTVVNKRTPDVMANFLRQRSDEISENDAFSNGILSTLIMSSDMVPNDPYVRGYCTYKTDPNDPA